MSGATRTLGRSGIALTTLGFGSTGQDAAGAAATVAAA